MVPLVWRCINGRDKKQEDSPLRKLFVLVLVVLGLWSGYWYLGKTAKQALIEAWFNARREAGWTARYGDFRMTGFPLRFDSRFTDLEIHGARSGMGWEAPRLDILTPAWAPNRVSVRFPRTQLISLPLQDVTVTSSRMSASVLFAPDSRLALRALRMEADDLAVKGSLGWRMSARAFSLSSTHNRGQAYAHDMVLDISGLTPTAALRASFDPAGTQPARIDRIRLDLTLAFSGPWDRVAVEQGAPVLKSVEVNSMNIAWGALGLGGDGLLAIAPDGRITGKLALIVRNWRGVLGAMVSARVIDRGVARQIARLVGLLTATASNPDALRIPLEFRRDGVFLGPVRLGPALEVVRRQGVEAGR